MANVFEGFNPTPEFLLKCLPLKQCLQCQLPRFFEFLWHKYSKAGQNQLQTYALMQDSLEKMSDRGELIRFAFSMGSDFKFLQGSCFEISLALIKMDLRENRCVCLGEVGVKDALKPGVYQEIPFSAAFIYGLLQPYVKANASEQNFVQNFVESAAFQAVTDEVDKQSGFRWAVKHGKFVGVFLSGYGLEALLSVDLAEDVKWKQAHAFHTLKEAVLFQMQGNRNPANYVWEYNPLQQPDTANTIHQLVEQQSTPVPSPPPTPTPAPKSHSSSDALTLSRSPPQTPSRSQGTGS
ncbi:hypothetical protein C8J55DRAFT_487033 [Lentinula edodes]|uniref:Uncharacterized protein n=1 Tax=Lentinula lateritia TaxID=40482 RepID=A0A9W9ARD0_9AGAR|nr:hypothetical protein C8J55DRAFT_487033 [Lentinula edodes]